MKTNNKVEIEVIRKVGEYVVKAFDGGGEPLSEYDFNYLTDNTKWIAYSYEAGNYEGSGYALIAYDDGLFSLEDLGHCSCYGPLENINSKGFF